MKNKKILLANCLLLVALFLYVLIPSIANRIFRLNGVISGNISLLLSGGASVIGLGGLALLYCGITKRKFYKVMVIKKISKKQVFLTMSVALGTYIFAIGVNSISMKLFPVAIKDGMAISNLLSTSTTALGLIVVVLLPAFFEEVFFRGVLLDAYDGINKKIKYFILTIIFASFHGNVMQIVYVMFLGLILLMVREYTGSLLGSMTLHATNNAISFILSKVAMSYMKVKGNGLVEGMPSTSQAANDSLTVVLLRALIFFLIGGAILYSNLKKLKEYKEVLDKSELIKNEEYIEPESYIERNEKVVDKMQYVPLVLYFISMIALVVRKY